MRTTQIVLQFMKIFKIIANHTSCGIEKGTTIEVVSSQSTRPTCAEICVALEQKLGPKYRGAGQIGMWDIVK